MEIHYIALHLKLVTVWMMIAMDMLILAMVVTVVYAPMTVSGHPRFVMAVTTIVTE